MKFLFDENLSPRLAEFLADIFPGSRHVHDLDMGQSDDRDIWEFAAREGFAIVTKDKDFHARSILRGHPPKVL